MTVSAEALERGGDGNTEGVVVELSGGCTPLA